MFITKSKKLAEALVEKKPLEEVVEAAREEIKDNPWRNCNFEFYIRDVIVNEELLEKFRNELIKEEKDSAGYLMKTKEGFYYTPFGSWNDCNIRFTNKIADGVFIRKKDGKWIETGIYFNEDKELTNEEIATLTKFNEIPA